MKDDEIKKEDETMEEDGIVEEDETPKGLVTARFLAGITIFLNMMNYMSAVSADANLPAGACGTGLVGYGIIQVFLFIIMLCCVIPWLYKEFNNYESTYGGIISIGICILCFIACVAFSRCVYSDPNRPINQPRPETEEYSDPVAIEVIEEATETIEDEEDTLDFRP